MNKFLGLLFVFAFVSFAIASDASSEETDDAADRKSPTVSHNYRNQAYVATVPLLQSRSRLSSSRSISTTNRPPSSLTSSRVSATSRYRNLTVSHPYRNPTVSHSQRTYCIPLLPYLPYLPQPLLRTRTSPDSRTSSTSGPLTSSSSSSKTLSTILDR